MGFQFKGRGSEKKEEEKKEEKKEENKEEEKKGVEKKEEEGNPNEVILKVDMHCEGCARKVQRSLKGFEGVEEVLTDSKSRKVVVKGNKPDPVKVCERIQKKSKRKAEIISPIPKPASQEVKKDDKENAKPEEKKEEPTMITVVLKVGMHCDACAQVLKKKIQKMKGVESAETNLTSEQVTVKGVIDPAKVVAHVYKTTGKHAVILPQEEKKEEKEEGGEKKEDEKAEEKKEGEGDDEKKDDPKKNEFWPSKYYYYTEYAQPPPQLFSDENPNACTVM
ncbi:hypothetical protein AMTRI_Chr10g227160 [Amborella trichopoda]